MAQAMGNKAATDAQFHYRYPTPKSPARKQHGMMGSLSDKLHWAACMMPPDEVFQDWQESKQPLTRPLGDLSMTGTRRDRDLAESVPTAIEQGPLRP